MRGDYKIEKQIPLIAFDEWRLRENEPHREQMARDESNRALRRLHAYEQQPDGTNNTGHPAINGQRRAPPLPPAISIGFHDDAKHSNQLEVVKVVSILHIQTNSSENYLSDFVLLRRRTDNYPDTIALNGSSIRLLKSR